MGLTSCQKVSANEIIQALVKGEQGIEIACRRDGRTPNTTPAHAYRLKIGKLGLFHATPPRPAMTGPDSNFQESYPFFSGLRFPMQTGHGE